MQEIADWLKTLGLSEYAKPFAENGIDVSALRHLTDQDLKDIGVLLGHRRKMLAAIRELSGAAPTIPEPATGMESKTQVTAERRQVTVMFSDLVGSTALSARMDPEDLREVISAYQKCVAGTVERFGGFVAKYMGDGVLVYFGYPQAHEDDAERAVRAGLEFVASITALKTRALLQTRVGIATGLVVIGDLIGSGEAQERGIVGETPNLAARLQAIAEPNVVVIGESTRKLLGNLFELDDLGAKDLKGIAGSVRAWAALRASSMESRFEAIRATRMTGFVGRKHEIALLLDRKRLAWQGEGQIVLVSGEAGIGKSRTAAAVSERLAAEPHTRLRYQCSPYHTNSALYPFIAHLERAAEIKPDDPPEQKLDKLEAVLAMGAPRVQAIAPIFAALLSIPFDGRYPPLAPSPAQQRRQTLAALLDQLEGLARRKSILLLFEDVHWADATSLELLDLMVDRLGHLPVLAIFTFRPGFEPAWAGLHNVTTLALGRLEPPQVQAMVEQVTGGRALPAEVMKAIINKTDGIPLFVEELTKTVLEADILVEDAEGYRLDGPLPPLAIPATLQDSLMARLDRLASIKEIAQVGAAIGREFSYALLQMVVARDDASLRSALTKLEEAELVFSHGQPPEAVYTFKHALVQDAAYSTLLHSRRQQLHARIATTLESQFPDIVVAQPQLIARHCTEAGLNEQAVGYWLKAGQQAIARGAMTEAIAQLGKGLDLLPDAAEGTGRWEQELNLQITLGHALLAAKGYSSSELGETYARARELCQRLNWPGQLGAVLTGQFVFCLVRGELDQAERHAEEIRHFGEARSDLMWNCWGSITSGSVCCYLGKFIDSRAYHEKALSTLDPRYRALVPTPEDPFVVVLSHLSRTLLYLGYVNQARLRRDEALADARRLSPYNMAFNLAYALWHRWIGDWATEGVWSAQTMLRSADELLANLSEQGAPRWFALGKIMRGWCLGTVGEAAEHIPLLVEELAVLRAVGSNLLLPFVLMLLAETYGRSARPEEGLHQLAEAADLIETTQERWAEAELHRLRGTLLLSVHEHAAAEDSYRQALAVARRQSAKFWELRAATSLARLWRDQDKRTEARDLLAPVYLWFTEGFDTPVLMEAKALLDELNA